MTREFILDFLQIHKRELENKFGLTKIGLFGSYAKNSYTDESDIDLAIAVKEKDFFIREDLRMYLEKHLKKNVDIGYIDSFREFYKRKIEKEIIYV